MINPWIPEQATTIRRAAENGLKEAQRLHSSEHFDSFQHIIDEAKRLEAYLLFDDASGESTHE